VSTLKTPWLGLKLLNDTAWPCRQYLFTFAALSTKGNNRNHYQEKRVVFYSGKNGIPSSNINNNNTYDNETPPFNPQTQTQA
jgi:hypothetical protein